MCISYPTSSDVITYVIITSENSGRIICCKDFMCVTLRNSRGINFVILAGSNGRYAYGRLVTFLKVTFASCKLHALDEEGPHHGPVLSFVDLAGSERLARSKAEGVAKAERDPTVSGV